MKPSVAVTDILSIKVSYAIYNLRKIKECSHPKIGRKIRILHLGLKKNGVYVLYTGNQGDNNFFFLETGLVSLVSFILK